MILRNTHASAQWRKLRRINSERYTIYKRPATAQEGKGHRIYCYEFAFFGDGTNVSIVNSKPGKSSLTLYSNKHINCRRLSLICIYGLYRILYDKKISTLLFLQRQHKFVATRI